MSDSDAPLVLTNIESIPAGNKTNEGPKPMNRKLPVILYDSSTTYRQNHKEIPPPYDDDKPWRAKIYQPDVEAAQGILPMQVGIPYPDPYELLNRTPDFERDGVHTMRAELERVKAEERKYDRGIPHANINIIPEWHVEPSTEYLDRFCTHKAAPGDSDVKLPDILPVHKRTHKYYNSSSKFSYNSTHDNKDY